MLTCLSNWFELVASMFLHFLTALSGRQDVWGSIERHLRSLGSDHDSLKHCISQNSSPAGVTQESLAVILPDQDVIHFDPICTWSWQPLLHVTSLSAFVFPYNTFNILFLRCVMCFKAGDTPSRLQRRVLSPCVDSIWTTKLCLNT